jgi:hypothetical protein
VLTRQKFRVNAKEVRVEKKVGIVVGMSAGDMGKGKSCILTGN